MTKKATKLSKKKKKRTDKLSPSQGNKITFVQHVINSHHFQHI